MALSGELKDFGLTQLLHMIKTTGKSGALTLQRSSEVATIFVRDGLLTKVKMPDSHGDNLPSALLRAGRIDRDQYNLMNPQVAASEQAVALLLEGQGTMSQEDVVEFAGKKCAEGLYSLLTWQAGTFRLDAGSEPPEDDILTPTDLGPILDRASDYLGEWQRLHAVVPSLDGVLHLVAQPEGKAREVAFTLEEWRLVATMSRDMPLRDVGRRLGLDEVDLKQLAYRLVSAGLAQLNLPESTSLMPIPEPRETEAEKSSTGFRLFGRRR